MSERIKQDLSIGANLKRLRKQNRFSQEQVAAKLQLMGISVSREMLSQMELGHYNIRVTVLLALKELYHATFDDFFEGLSLSDLDI
ncbi:MAG: helix-turn-helix transcriptional regulator [Oscillospiraceae bacterium]|nr:helix-turn-helix transcriptional regulator [Oscillospiraceae bacterium]